MRGVDTCRTWVELVAAVPAHPVSARHANPRWARVTEEAGRTTWAVGVCGCVLWRGPAGNWQEAQRHVGRLLVRLEAAG